MSADWPTRRLGKGPVATAFVARGCSTFGDAVNHVWDLRYGRNKHPADTLCVLEEERGTCSTKHALLARLAEEQGIEADLLLGIYMMREENTRGVGNVLERHGLDAIPEAHCVLEVAGERIDASRRSRSGNYPSIEFLRQEVITPDQVNDYKRAFHRRYIADWASTGGGGGRDPDELWRIREECIAAL
jgi:hypothetical protein